jgi:phosphosulfolactate synthase (CoM biosynthesis protein A)
MGKLYLEDVLETTGAYVDHSQVVQLECLRSGIWGTKSLWGRVLTYKG